MKFTNLEETELSTLKAIDYLHQSDQVTFSKMYQIMCFYQRKTINTGTILKTTLNIFLCLNTTYPKQEINQLCTYLAFHSQISIKIYHKRAMLFFLISA
jgi:hypothetical protein